MVGIGVIEIKSLLNKSKIIRIGADDEKLMCYFKHRIRTKAIIESLQKNLEFR